MKRFKMKDIVFLAITSALLILVSGIIMPIVMFTNQFALRQVLAAPIFAIFITIALIKVPKIGSLSIIGVLTGVFLLMMSPIMFFNNIVGAILTEILIVVIFKGYSSNKAIFFASMIYMPITIPVSLIYTATMEGISIIEKVKSPAMALTFGVLSIILGIIGAKLGFKLAKELQKAGKLEVSK
ncbi:MptD family putative ECF transporter S component [Miniphocaeibacter massiliensis]|uniref:MptD family putative ECF transporter S component n=1 Tax=Miniphocaeibacter massiliensis TaxID=2041841 RepID=UPI000C1BB8AE|nr:MptD family putative ECF transporter S component [Miniphocaeibacter massiliensis]